MIKSKYYNFFIMILIVIYFTDLLIKSLLIGGGWDLNTHIAFAQRIIDSGIFSYSSGDSDLFIPSSPYYPGVGFLATLLLYFDLDPLQTAHILLVIAAIIGFLYFVSLVYITKILYPFINITMILVISILMFILDFNLYKHYMLEFKPDTIILLFSNFIFILIWKHNKYKKFLNVCILVLLLLLFIIPFKQTFFFTYLAFFIAFFPIKSISKNKKFLFSFIVIVFAIVLLVSMFLYIDNLYYFTVEIMKQHHFDILFFMGSIKGFIVGNLFFGLFLFLYLIFFLKKDIIPFSFQNLKVQYLLFSLVFSLFSIVGALKIGGNSGNLEVGFVVFLPFSVYAFYSIFSKASIKNILPSILPIIIFIVIIYYIVNIRFNLLNLKRHFNQQNNIVNYLKSNFVSNNKVLVDGKSLIYVLSAKNYKSLIGYTSISHFNNTINYQMPKLLSNIKNKHIDLIVISNNANSEFSSVYQEANTDEFKKIGYYITNNYKYVKKYNLYFYTPKD